MLASFMLFVDFDAVSWEGVKFRGRACQRRDLSITGICLKMGVPENTLPDIAHT